MMTEPRQFAPLMRDLRRGDPDAARAVFDRYAYRLAAVAALRLPPVSRAKLDPEDVAQSVFRTFFRRHAGGEFTPDHWASQWSLLAVLAARKCGHRVDYLFAARREVRLPDPAADPADGRPQPPDPAPAPEDAAALAECVDRVLAGLTDRERVVVVLRLYGYTVPEVADRARCSERTVHRVLRTVRGRLGGRAAD